MAYNTNGYNTYREIGVKTASQGKLVVMLYEGAVNHLEKSISLIGDEGKVELKRVKNPKEITCKGGLNMKPADFIDDIDEYKFCYTASATIERKGHIHYLRDVDDTVSKEVMQFYNCFIEYFFSLNAKFSFEKKFGIQTQKDFEKYKEILLEHAREDLAAVLDLRRTEHDDPDAELEDSLFFFPMAGGLNRLTAYIAER